MRITRLRDPWVAHEAAAEGGARLHRVDPGPLRDRVLHVHHEGLAPPGARGGSSRMRPIAPRGLDP